MGGVYGVHKTIIVTVKAKLLSDFGIVVETEEGDWSKLKTQLSGAKATETDEEIKGLSTESSSDDLKNWCSNSLEKNYSSAILGEYDDFLSKVKKYCYLTIQLKLENAIDLDSSENPNTDITSRFDALKTYTSGDSKPSIPSGHALETIKSGAVASPATKTANDLKEWCRGVYKIVYKSKADTEGINYQLAGQFCVKAAAAS